MNKMISSPTSVLRGWPAIWLSVIGILWGAATHALLGVLFVCFVYVFVRQIRYVNKYTSLGLLVIVIVASGCLMLVRQYNKVLYPVLGSEVSFSGEWIASKDSFASNETRIDSLELFTRDVCDHDYSSNKQCKTAKEMKLSLRPGMTVISPSILKIDNITTSWTEGSGTTLTVHFTDPFGVYYFMSEERLIEVINNNYAHSTVLSERVRAATTRCWGVQSCWTKNFYIIYAGLLVIVFIPLYFRNRETTKYQKTGITTISNSKNEQILLSKNNIFAGVAIVVFVLCLWFAYSFYQDSQTARINKEWDAKRGSCAKTTQSSVVACGEHDNKCVQIDIYMGSGVSSPYLVNKTLFEDCLKK